MQSHICSAGVLRLCQPGSDEDVLRGIHVPVVPGAAVGARPMACPKGQRREQMPAHAARLAGRVPAINDHHPLTGLFGLVSEHRHGRWESPRTGDDLLRQRVDGADE